MEHDQPEWLQSAKREWGYGRIQVRDGHELSYEFVQSEDGRVADSVTLYNSRSNQWLCSAAQKGRSSSAPAPHGQLQAASLLRRPGSATA